MNNRQFFTPSGVHLRESEGEEPSRTIEGYAILFNSLSAPLWQDDKEVAREQIAPTAITKELLDSSDIKMTMFHDMQLILGRSKMGQGTLSYNVDERGVSFSFEAPNTEDGNKALELVKRGDIDGCSFMFSCDYWNEDNVERSVANGEGGRKEITYTVKSVDGIYDFTLTPSPAYPETSCAARELREQDTARREATINQSASQVAEMRSTAKTKIIF